MFSFSVWRFIFFFSDLDCSVMEYRSTGKWSMVKCTKKVRENNEQEGIDVLGEQTVHES